MKSLPLAVLALAGVLKAAGVADSIARAIIGHESKAVSRVYTHLDLETMRAALDKVAGAES